MRSPSSIHTRIILITLLLLWNAPASPHEIDCLHTQQSVASAIASRTQMNPPTYSGDISSRQAFPSFILVGDTQRTSLVELPIGRAQNDSARQLVLNKMTRACIGGREASLSCIPDYSARPR
jgi:hypothetical protein